MAASRSRSFAMKISSLSLIAAAVILSSVVALAQPAPQPQTLRLRGTVQTLDGDTLTVLSTANKAVKVTLQTNTNVMGVAARPLSSIKDGDFVGVTAGPGPDGHLHATEVHLFPDNMRGTGEGHYPWDFPKSTMTNATVTGVLAASDGRTLKLNYKDGQQEIDVSPDTPVVALVPGDRSLLKAGAAVVIIGTLNADNTIQALAVTAEKNGVKPPM
jgi:hypothetical protein